ncbi:unnamed protein product [Durusdinium trenchii]|uniref:RNA helicase n=1 Tax=Durusdinium trenchii TaxID=1381693 RepID=A0ABP0SN64_9DINO
MPHSERPVTTLLRPTPNVPSSTSRPAQETKMRKIFDHLQEKSPVMKASKMERAMQLLGLNPTPAQVCDVLHRVGQPVVLDFEAFGQAMKEAQASWSKSAEAQAEELRKCFEDFDPEKKGFLPRSTIAKIMSIDSGFFSEKQLEDMLRGVPLTSDGYRYSDLIEKLLDEEALSSDVSEGSDQNESGFGEERGKAQLERQLAEVREDHQEQSEMMQATLREELAEARQAKEAAEAKLREELAEARQAKEAAQALAEEKAKLLAEEATLREELAEARQAKEAAQATDKYEGRDLEGGGGHIPLQVESEGEEKGQKDAKDAAKEKHKLDDDGKIFFTRSNLCLALCVTLREVPSVLSGSRMGDKTFKGRIKEGAKYCYASYPGKFKTGFVALTSDEGEFSEQSVACVYFCTKEDGLGKHHTDPEDPKGRCFCRWIYGEGNDLNRDYETFGYLHWVGEPYTKEKVEEAERVAQAMGAVLLQKDASEFNKQKGKEEAKRRWNKSGRVPAWGCDWFYVWFGHMKNGVRQGQRLKVVFYPGMAGKGTVTMKDLQDPKVSLWDSDPKKRGLGGSQKAEVAMIEAMRERYGDAWAYDPVDVSDFLKDSFSCGQTVAAWHDNKWHRGEILEVPSGRPGDGLEWKVKSKETGQTFPTEHLRHESAAPQTLADKLSEPSFMKALKDCLPEGQEVVTTIPKEQRLHNGDPAITFDLQSANVEALKKLCSTVLSGDLEFALNAAAFKQQHDLAWQVQIEKTEFVKAYKNVLMSSTKLTLHQEEKLRELDEPGDVHLAAAAGSGKTFIAVRKILSTLGASTDDQVLFVAPSKCLCLHFLRWFVAMTGDGSERLVLEDVRMLLSRVRFLHAPYESLMTASIKSGARIELARDEHPTFEFVLTVVDEAHDIFRPDVHQGLLIQTLRSSQKRIILSDASQSSAFVQNYPLEFPVRRVSLDQVIRCTERIVLGAKSFQLNSDQGDDVTSVGSNGPPLKTFIFERGKGAPPLYEDYCQNTMQALKHVSSSYPRLTFHHNIAIMVPDLNFLGEFKPLLEEKLKEDIGCRPLCKKLGLIDFEESLSYLISSHADEEQASEAEMMILDTIDNAKGLEQLIIVAVGMDAEISPTGHIDDLLARARLYQSITRAQLMAIVVNEYVPGGGSHIWRIAG